MLLQSLYIYLSYDLLNICVFIYIQNSRCRKTRESNIYKNIKYRITLIWNTLKFSFKYGGSMKSNKNMPSHYNIYVYLFMPMYWKCRIRVWVPCYSICLALLNLCSIRCPLNILMFDLCYICIDINLIKINYMFLYYFLGIHELCSKTCLNQTDFE